VEGSVSTIGRVDDSARSMVLCCGLTVEGMTHQGWTFSSRPPPPGIGVPSPVGIVGGTAWQPTPWRAVQRAAWEALKVSD
jgi:hypothetical protein